MALIIGNVGDLRAVLNSLPTSLDAQRVDVWYENTGKTLVAVGIDGENTDFSFFVFDNHDQAEAYLRTRNL
jgi:hypothetical protein